MNAILQWFVLSPKKSAYTEAAVPMKARPVLPQGETEGTAEAVFQSGLRGAFITLGCMVLVGFIALLNHGTGPYLSFGIFYLIPVAICAWWCGFAHGIMITLCAALAWHLIDTIDSPMIPLIATVWNGIVRFGTLVLTSSLISRLHVAVVRERLMARTDPLTGAVNGRTFYEAAAIESERARRCSWPLTLAYFDLDDFKQLNDRLGHVAGDAALVHLVKTVNLCLRTSDLLARLGGDEFALLLPATESQGAVTLLNRLQDVLAQEMARKNWPVTLSVGAITFTRPTWDVDLMIQRVDALMYRAKKKGKGRVEHDTLEAMPTACERDGAHERRATPRLWCHRQALVRRQGDALARFATVRDISAEGISLQVDCQYPINTLIIVESMVPSGLTLLARVVHATADDKGWRHGCKLATRLDAMDLDTWIDGR
jgi:diguanylate cyclase (GGDEF)-like protein